MTDPMPSQRPGEPDVATPDPGAPPPPTAGADPLAPEGAHAAAPPTAPDLPPTGTATGGQQRTSEDIRRDIEGTRAELGETITEIEDRVSPKRIKERQTERARSRWQSMRSQMKGTTTKVRERVMGSSDDDSGGGPSRGEQARQQVSDKREDVANRVQEGTEQARRQMRGNPLAAGLVAFGAGALASSLLPTTKREQEAAQQLRERAEEPLREGLQETGQHMQEDLRDQAQQRAKEVGKEAMHAAARTGSEAQDSAQRVKDESQQE